MVLSSTRFEQILANLRSDHTEQKGTEKRTSPRVGVRADVQVDLDPRHLGTRIVNGWIRDISRSGVGLLLKVRLRQGNQFIVHIPGEEDDKPMAILCTVKHCCTRGEDRFQVGATFTRLSVRPAKAPVKPPIKSCSEPQAAMKAAPVHSLKIETSQAKDETVEVDRIRDAILGVASGGPSSDSQLIK